MIWSAWKYLIVVALLFTALVLNFLAPGSLSWVDVVVTFVVGGIYAGAITGIIASYRRLRTEQPGCDERFAVAGIGSMATIVALVVLGILQYPRGDWRQLPAPPERAAEILDSVVYMVFGDEVWIRAESGAIYSLGCGDNRSCSWERQSEVPELETRADEFCDSSEARYRPPFKWGRSRDEQVTHFCGTDYTVETHFRLMEDSTLWRWETFRGMGNSMMSLLTMVAGFVLTLVVAFLYRGSGNLDAGATGLTADFKTE